MALEFKKKHELIPKTPISCFSSNFKKFFLIFLSTSPPQSLVLDGLILC